MKRIILFLALLIAARAASADGFFTPLTTDASMEYLGRLFGETPFTHGSGSPLASLFQTLNTALLAIGGGLVSYSILKGVIGTSVDAEVMGHSMHSAWYPIKLLLSVALLTPMKAGLSGAQLLCLFLISNGVGLADQAWSSYITSSFSPSSIVTATADQGSAEGLAKSLVLSYTCMARVNKTVSEGSGLTTETASRKAVQNADTVVIQYGTASDPTLCGTVTYSTKATAKDALAAQVQTAILSAQGPALQAMEATIAPVGTALANNQSADAGAIQQATAAYAQAITQARQAALGGNEASILSKFKSEAAQQGWFYAGTWYSKISELSAALSSAGGAPKYTAPATSRYMPGLADTESAMQHAEGYIDKTAKAQTGEADSDSRSDDLTQKIQAAWNGKAVALLQKLGGVFTGNQDADPIGSIKTVGDYTTDFAVMTPLAVAGTVFGVVLIGNGASLTAAGPAFLAALKIVSPILQYLTIPTLIFGVIFGIWVPMLPYVSWTIAANFYLLLCVEAMFFVSIWTLAHVAHHGEGFGGEAGFFHLLAIILRPFLMVVGLIASMVTFKIAVDFVGKTYFQTILSLNSSTFIGGVYFVGYLAIFCMLIMALQLLCLSPIWRLPAAATTWLGGHASDTAEAHSTQNATMIAAGVLSKNSHTATDGAKSAGGAASEKLKGNGGNRPDNPGGAGGPGLLQGSPKMAPDDNSPPTSGRK